MKTKKENVPMRLQAAVTLLVALWNVGVISAQSGSRAAPRAPVVETTPDGQHTIRFTEQQRAAIAEFQQANPDFLPANCQNLSLTGEQCKNTYAEWEGLARRENADVQFPFAVWGDFNRDGKVDFALAFFSKTKANDWGWRNWRLVVFHGNRDGTFTPVVAMKDTWGACLDGMLYHPARKQIEYWCGSGAGSFRWNGAAYVGKRMKAD